MPSINLSSGYSEDGKGGNKMGVNWGLITLVILFLITVAAWGYLHYANSGLDQKISQEQAKNTTLQKNLSGGKASEVLDFKNRLELAGDLNKNNQDVTENLGQLEKAMVDSGVYIDNYSFKSDQKTIDLSLVGDNYIALSREVLALKQLGYFTDVSAGISGFLETQKKYTLAVSLKLK